MVATMKTKKVKPWHGKWLSRSKANKINDMFESAVVPDRTALKREADEFEAYMLAKREKIISSGGKW